MHRPLATLWRRLTAARHGRRKNAKPLNYARPLTLEQFECRSLLATVTLTAVADNTMFEESGDLSNGAGIYFFVGRTAGTAGALSRRGLVRFNLAGAVPAGSQVTTATLRLNESRVPGGPVFQMPIALHRASANWGEGTSDAVCIGGNEGCGATATTNDATWSHSVYPSTTWNTPGGDFAGGASATTTVGGLGSYQWTSPQLAADVQGWVNAPASNFGWVIKEVDESVLRSAKRFDSRQNAAAANRPQLVIEYNAASGNSAPTLNAIPNPPAILEDSGLQTINLSGISAGSGETQELTLTAVSSNPGLIPNPTVNYVSPNTGGSLSYTSGADQAGTAVITVTLQDDGGTDGGGVDTIVRTFTVTVTQVNDAPEIDPIVNPAPVPEDGGLRTVSLTGILDGPNETQTLTITATSNNPSLIPNPTIAYINPNSTGTLSFTPAANQSGTATITVTVTDNGGTANGGDNVTTRTFSINVTPVNDAPTLTPIANPAAILEDTATQQIINLAGIGAGGGETQTLTVTVSSSNPALIPNPNVNYTSPSVTGTLSYTPAANQFGSATITVTVRDSGGTAPGVDTVIRTFTVNVTGVNDAPTLAAIADPPAIARNAGAQTVNLTGIGAGPNETQALTITATSSNPGLIPNPTVTYTSPAATGSLSYTPVANQIGAAVITVTVTDNGGTANSGVNVFTRTFTVNVTTINAAPTLEAIADPIAILEDAAAQTVNLAGISAGPGETQTLTVTAVSSNPGLIPNPTVTYASPSATGTLSYTPVAHQSGTAVITVTVTDNGGTAGGGIDTVTRTFTVNVTPVNDTPTLDAIPNPPFIQQNAGLQTINLAGISAGPSETQAVTITATSSNPGLIPNPTVDYTSPAATGSLSYTPVADQGGNAVITVTVTDDGGTTSGGVNFVTRTFTVTVFVSTAANDPPSFAKGPDQAVIDGSGPKTVLGWATAISPGPPDEASQAVDFVVTNNSNALFLVQPAIDSVGTLTFTPQPNVSGLVLVTVVLHDDGGTLAGGVDTSPPQTFTIDISKPHPWHNRAPLAAPKIGSLDVDGDGSISPIDAVLVINYLNARRPTAIPPGAPIGGPNGIGPNTTAFLDTGGGPNNSPDNFVSPIDAVLVINWLNSHPVGSAGGESAAPLAAGAAIAAETGSEAENTLAQARPADLSELISLLAFDAADGARLRRRR
jgi:hypothetical protein